MNELNPISCARWRARIIHQQTDAAGLDRRALSTSSRHTSVSMPPPTAWHVGSLVQIMLLRRLAQTVTPHRADGRRTTKVGDPSGGTKRGSSSRSQINSNIAGIREISGHFCASTIPRPAP